MFITEQGNTDRKDADRTAKGADGTPIETLTAKLVSITVGKVVNMLSFMTIGDIGKVETLKSEIKPECFMGYAAPLLGDRTFNDAFKLLDPFGSQTIADVIVVVVHNDFVERSMVYMRKKCHNFAHSFYTVKGSTVCVIVCERLTPLPS